MVEILQNCSIPFSEVALWAKFSQFRPLPSKGVGQNSADLQHPLTKQGVGRNPSKLQLSLY